MMITGIDHIAIQVRDLDTTVANYEVIFGRTPNWRGHVGDVRHAWFQFDSMALDVIGANDETDAGRAIKADIDKHGEGVWGLGYSVPDLDAARHTLERRGLTFSGTHITRSVNAEGVVREWRLAIAKRKSSHGPAQFFVEKPHDVWPTAPVNAEAAVSGLDHIVVHTANIDRALAYYGARLGLDLRLDRSNEQWGVRQLFFRCGGPIVEIGASLKDPVSDKPDTFGGLAWRIADPVAARERIAKAGIDVSDVRKGRKPGTAVFTVRAGTGGVPTLMLSGNE
jgi:catechol 2,3-dioxygenase-like lactoylglutathione lyase family enzyme